MLPSRSLGSSIMSEESRNSWDWISSDRALLETLRNSWAGISERKKKKNLYLVLVKQDLFDFVLEFGVLWPSQHYTVDPIYGTPQGPLL